MAGYQLFLPKLYRHVELGHRNHIKQLEQGFHRNLYLKETVRQALLALPRLTHLDFQYCELTSTYSSTSATIASAAVLSEANAAKTALTCHAPNLTSLNLLWTDFSADAIRQLFSFAPNLNRVVLGANHNRKPMANDTALQLLTANCLHVKDLSISLQQVKETSLCQVIQMYGAQLQHLSIRCEGNDTLWAISQYTKQLRQLVLRCSNYTGGYHSVLHVLQDCRALQHLEMVSWPLHDVPSIVLDQIRYKAAANIVTVSSTVTAASSNNASTSFIEGIKRTVALDKQDLQEIRKLCLY
ncbi:hypothetical protein [Parasitella parasitica]|uniref:F-box domain-containing protein n=1 Tax=Parasitella parasitica TaxID=35722 RepID=A0A0B7NSU1_9FUNG|nr:hypothetical protein [Parasitella parasitica]